MTNEMQTGRAAELARVRAVLGTWTVKRLREQARVLRLGYRSVMGKSELVQWLAYRCVDGRWSL